MADNIRDQLEHEQRVRELLEIRKMDGKWEFQTIHLLEIDKDQEGVMVLLSCYSCNVFVANPEPGEVEEFLDRHKTSEIVYLPNRYEIKDPLLELNIRMSQYIAQFHFSVEYFIVQCLRDFINAPMTIILHKGGKVDYSKPVALIGNKAVYANKALRRDEISLSSPVFSYQKVVE